MADRYTNDKRFKQARARLRGRPCIYCGAPSDTVEHLIPRSSGLPVAVVNRPSNMAPACSRCNYSRGAKLRWKKAKAGWSNSRL